VYSLVIAAEKKIKKKLTFEWEIDACFGTCIKKPTYASSIKERFSKTGRKVSGWSCIR
jgi:hypothetical protein